MGQFVAGWYPDPLNSELQRWWDGTAWSDHTAPRQAPRPVPAAIIPAPPAAWAAPTVAQPVRAGAADSAAPNIGSPAAATGGQAAATGGQAGVTGKQAGQQAGEKPGLLAAFVSGASVPVRLWSQHRTAMLVAFALNTAAQLVVFLTREAGDSTGYLLIAIATLVVCVAAFALAARAELNASKISGGRTAGRSVDQSIVGDGKRLAACGGGVLLAGLVVGAAVTVVAGVLGGLLVFAAIAAVVLGGIAVLLWVFGDRSGSGTATEEWGPEVRGINSHFTEGGPPKVEYGTQRQADEAASDMGRKYGYAFSTYVCERGGHYHVGKTR